MWAGKVATAAAILLAGFCAPAQAGTSNQFEQEFGAARAPIGFVSFCATSPDDCRSGGRMSLLAPRIDASPENMSAISNVNTYVNAKIKPVSDQELYGVVERWAIPVDAGDCEDYVLLKKRYLEDLGFPSQALLITVVMDEHKEGHAVLTVATKAGDFVLDNRRDQVLRWSNTKYEFLKRQSVGNPLEWVSLSRKGTPASPSVASGSK